MISQDQNAALLTLANQTQNNPEWSLYSSYCLKREQGLRKEAFTELNQFLKKTHHWTFEQKKTFISFLFPIFETVKDADYGGFPYPLSVQLIKPTLEQWCHTETKNSAPFRWYGKYYQSEPHLCKAIALNPQDDTARSTLISNWDYRLYYATHHLPHYFIGSPKEALELAQQTKQQINALHNEKLKIYWHHELTEVLTLIHHYIESDK